MSHGRIVAVLFVTAMLAGSRSDAQTASRPPGILLEGLTWNEAEAVLTPDTVVVIPIGAEAKDHGPHLKLRNDFTIVEDVENRVPLPIRHSQARRHDGGLHAPLIVLSSAMT